MGFYFQPPSVLRPRVRCFLPSVKKLLSINLSPLYPAVSISIFSLFLSIYLFASIFSLSISSCFAWQARHLVPLCRVPKRVWTLGRRGRFCVAGAALGDSL